MDYITYLLIVIMITIFLVCIFVFLRINKKLENSKENNEPSKKHSEEKNNKIPSEKKDPIPKDDCLCILTDDDSHNNLSKECEQCFIGTITSDSTLPIIKSYTSLPMVMLFGEFEDDTKGWNYMHELHANKCEAIDSPFLYNVSAKNNDLAIKSIQKFFEKKIKKKVRLVFDKFLYNV